MNDSLTTLTSDSFTNNTFYEGLSIEITGGIIATIIVLIIIYYRKKIYPNKFDDSDERSNGKIENELKQEQKQNVKVDVKVHNVLPVKENASNSPKSNLLSLEDRRMIIDSMKNKIKILFIDDDTKFEVVTILKADGWKHTSSVSDVRGLEIPKVKEANVYFVDINGVGKLLNCKYEGLDLAQMLKEKYPDKKVIIYSANKDQNSFHPAWELCDRRLEKNALPNQFESIVDDYCIELYDK